MARRRERTRTYPSRVVVISTPTPRLVRRVALPFDPLSDRRRFDFERATRPAFVTFGPRAAARLVVRSDVRRDPYRFAPQLVPYAVGFADPRRVDLCRRREDRKRVLHALRIAGGRGFRRRRLTPWSEIRC